MCYVGIASARQRELSTQTASSRLQATLRGGDYAGCPWRGVAGEQQTRPQRRPLTLF